MEAINPRVLVLLVVLVGLLLLFTGRLRDNNNSSSGSIDTSAAMGTIVDYGGSETSDITATTIIESTTAEVQSEALSTVDTTTPIAGGALMSVPIAISDHRRLYRW